MKKILLLASANIRKTKGQTIILALLFLISSLMLNIGLIVMLGFGSFYDKTAEELNTSDIYIAIPESKFGEQVEDFFRTREEINEFSINNSVTTAAEFSWKNEMFSFNVTFCDINEPRELSNWKLVSGELSDNPDTIYVPYIYNAAGGIKIGDKLTYKTEDLSFDFIIGGYVENIYQDRMSSVGDVVFVQSERFAEIQSALPDYRKKLVFINGTDNYTTLETHILELINISSENSFMQNINELVLGVDYPALKNMRTSLSSMISAMMIVFTAVIAIVCLLVIRFRINNSIEEDMPKIGSLQAIGYTGGQITSSIMLQYGMIALLACLLGVIPVYLVLPFVSRVFAQQSGLFWESGFELMINLASIIALTVTVAVVAFIAALKIRKINPVRALRGGITTHSFKRNYIPLDKSRMPLTWALSFKSVLQGFKQSVTIFIVITAISFTASVAAGMYYNAAIDLSSFEKVPGIERANAAVVFDREEDVTAMENEILAHKDVWKAQYVDNSRARVDGIDVGAIVMADYSKKETVNVYKGVFPRYDNEIAIAGLLAGKIGKSIGDEVLVGKDEVPYLITGFTQGMEAGSHTVYLTYDGMKKINPDFTPMVYMIYLNKGTDAALFTEEMEAVYGKKLLAATDADASFAEGVSGFASVISIVGLVIIIITGFVVILVLYFVISSSIIRRRRELGIQKAIGYTTANLMNQIALSFLFPLTLGAIIGCVLGALGANPLMSIGMSQMGIMKAAYIVSVPWTTGAGICIVVLSYLTSIFITWRIRKISAYSLVTE